MNAKEAISSFEQNLESVIKTAFQKAIEFFGEFDISVDYDTHTRIDELVKGLDLTVHGMSVAPSELIITFKFTGLYNEISVNIPRYCRIKFENDGNYFLELKEADLKKNWHCGVTDFNFNTRILQEEAITEALKEMNEVLLMIKLSN
jgi:hypothetical protein